MPQGKRPERLCVTDETGAIRTLAVGPGTFTTFGHGERPVFLGLGPDPAVAATLLAGRRAVFLECPEFAAAMPPSWAAAIPTHWTSLDPAAITPEFAARSTFYWYRHNPRLFPSFWGPIWARTQLALLPRPDRTAVSGDVLLARPQHGMLEPEIARALTVLGKKALDVPATDSAPAIARALRTSRPELFLCVNGAGLDDDGLVFSLLAAAGIPVAVWFVDNPFHILGRFRGPFWKDMLLCVTDGAFCDPLRELGAHHVLALPLAAANHFFGATPTAPAADRVIFVGRSAFPGRNAFFAGCRLPEGLLETAHAMLDCGARPDFFWWRKHLAPGPLWPGKTVRLAGYGAETASLHQRVAVLAALAATTPCTVYGDPDWKNLLPPGTDLRGPVDYYGALPGLYAGAGITANVTSLLLPRGLTQRHFDVWAAGGCLITDATPGLDLFPPQLTVPVTYAAPREAAALAQKLLATPKYRQELSAAWAEHIAAAHRYEHRLQTLFAHIPNG